MNEQDVRRLVHKQRCFYAQALEIGVFNVAILLIWLLFSTISGFWPKYVILASLIWLAVKAYQAGLMPFFKEKACAVQNKLHFMSDKWEEEKVGEMMGKTKKKASTSKATKKPAQKKVVGRTKKKS